MRHGGCLRLPARLLGALASEGWHSDKPESCNWKVQQPCRTASPSGPLRRSSAPAGPASPTPPHPPVFVARCSPKPNHYMQWFKTAQCAGFQDMCKNVSGAAACAGAALGNQRTDAQAGRQAAASCPCSPSGNVVQRHHSMEEQ